MLLTNAVYDYNPVLRAQRGQGSGRVRAVDGGYKKNKSENGIRKRMYL